MKKNILLIILFAGLFIGTSACVSLEVFAKNITVESGEIPPEMKTEKFILVGVLHDEKAVQKSTRQAFEKYTGEYVIGSLSEIRTKYRDLDKYRYLVDYKVDDSAYGKAGNYTYQYFITDRKTNIQYVKKTKSSFFERELTTYLMAIDLVRLSNP